MKAKNIIIGSACFLSFISCKTVFSLEPLQVNTGIMRIGGLFQSNFSDTNNGPSRFSVPYAGVNLNGDVIPERMGFSFKTNFKASSLDTVVTEAKIDAKYLPATTISFGRIISDWGVEQGIRGRAKQYFIEKAMIEKKMSSETQTGVRFKVEIDPIIVKLGLYNGSYSAISGNNIVSNGSKEGFIGVDMSVLPQYLKGYVFSTMSYKVKNYGLGLEGNYSDAYVMVEYAGGKMFDEKKSGIAGEFGYTLVDLVMPKYRIDYYKNITENINRTKHTFGFNLVVSEFNSLIRFDYSVEKDLVNENKFALQMQVAI